MSQLYTKIKLYLEANSKTWDDDKVSLQNDSDGKGDYIEFFGNVTTGSGTPLFKGQSTRFDTHALGYKLIGV